MTNYEKINAIIEKSTYNKDMIISTTGMEVTMWNEDTETEYYLQIDLQAMDACEIN